MPTVLGIGLIQCLILLSLVFQKRHKSGYDQLLLAWLFVFALHLLLMLLIQLGYQPRIVLSIAKSINLLHGPFLVLYAFSVFNGKVNRTQFFHFAPFIIIVMVDYVISPVANSRWEYAMALMKIISISIYSIYCFQWSGRKIRELKKTRSDSIFVEAGWVKVVAILMLLMIGLGVLHIVSVHFMNEQYYTLLDIGLYVLLIILLGYYGLKQGVVYVPPSNTNKTGYKHSPLSEEQKKELKTCIKQYFEKETDFLQQDFSLSTLSAQLDIPKHHLSETINQDLGITFFALVNKNRVAHVIELMKEGRADEMSLEGLGFSAGFNTKSAFFRNFKEHTGQTPSQYLRAIKKS